MSFLYSFNHPSRCQLACGTRVGRPPRRPVMLRITATPQGGLRVTCGGQYAALVELTTAEGAAWIQPVLAPTGILAIGSRVAPPAMVIKATVVHRAAFLGKPSACMLRRWNSMCPAPPSPDTGAARLAPAEWAAQLKKHVPPPMVTPDNCCAWCGSAEPAACTLDGLPRTTRKRWRPRGSGRTHRTPSWKPSKRRQADLFQRRLLLAGGNGPADATTLRRASISLPSPPPPRFTSLRACMPR